MPTPAERAAAILAESGAIVTDSHIVYTSGRHGSAYVNKDAVYPHTERVSELCRLIADAVSGHEIDIVCGPATGAIILSQWTGHHLGRPAVYAEKAPGGGMVLKRGYDRLVAGKRVLLVEDVLNTGGSLHDTVKAVEVAGGRIVVAAALVNRGGVTPAHIGAPALVSLLSMTLDSWAAADCPLCRTGVPVNTDVGKGREFLRATTPSAT